VENLQKVEEHVPELDTKNSRMPISSRPGPGVELTVSSFLWAQRRQ